MTDQILELQDSMRSGAFEQDNAVVFPTAYSFTRWCAFADLIPMNPSKWQEAISLLQYNSSQCQETLNIQVVVGELRQRFSGKNLDTALRVLQTLQQDHQVVMTQNDSKLVANVLTFVLRVYLDDIERYSHSMSQDIGFLLEINEALFFNLSKTILLKQVPAMEDFFAISEKIDLQLTIQLRTFELDTILFAQSLFVDVIPDKLLKKLYQAALKVDSWQLFSVFYLHSLRFFFRSILMKAKDKEAIRHICSTSCIASLESITKTEFLYILQKSCAFFSINIYFQHDTFEKCIVFSEISKDDLNPKCNNEMIRRQVSSMKLLHITISRQIEKTIKLLQKGIIGQISRNLPVDEEIVQETCEDIKRMRDLLVNLLPIGKFDPQEQGQKVCLLCDMYSKICEKQKVLDTLGE